MSDDTLKVPLSLVKSILANGREGFVSKADADSLRDLLAQPSDGDLANEGAEPVAWADPKAFENFKAGVATHEWMWAFSDTGLAPLYRHPLKVCTCPSGDGSLRWPCPVHPPEVKVPEGWKLVPVEPTDDMIVAFAEAWYSKRQAIDDPEMLEAYADMLAVAPASPEVKALVLPERKDPTLHWIEPCGVAKADGWNACLDRVKELNS